MFIATSTAHLYHASPGVKADQLADKFRSALQLQHARLAQIVNIAKPFPKPLHHKSLWQVLNQELLDVFKLLYASHITHTRTHKHTHRLTQKNRPKT